MGLYETLKAAKLGAAPDVFTKLRAQIAPFAKGGATEKELEDTPPLSFNANGEPLIDWIIYGATMETGDRTANLCSSQFEQGGFNSGTGEPTASTDSNYKRRIRSASFIALNSGTYTISTNYDVAVYVYDTDENYQSSESYTTWNTTPFTFQLEANRKIKLIFRNIGTNTQLLIDDFDNEVMLNTGSTALLYEPYGYKIPVQCGGVTTNIYLAAPLGTSDSISMTDTGISIPTVKGSNALSVGTTVQPSSVYIKYKE